MAFPLNPLIIQPHIPYRFSLGGHHSMPLICFFALTVCMFRFTEWLQSTREVWVDWQSVKFRRVPRYLEFKLIQWACMGKRTTLFLLSSIAFVRGFLKRVGGRETCFKRVLSCIKCRQTKIGNRRELTHVVVRTRCYSTGGSVMCRQHAAKFVRNCDSVRKMSTKKLTYCHWCALNACERSANFRLVHGIRKISINATSERDWKKNRK
jgi:hypothetical protein